MKTNLTIDIGLDVADQREAERFEDALAAWLNAQKGVTDMRVLHNGDLNSAAWRQSRARVFGSERPSPFSRPGETG